jgi:hypothetical protein
MTEEESDEPQTPQLPEYKPPTLPEYPLSDVIQMGQAVSSLTSFEAEAGFSGKSQLKVSVRETSFTR